MIGLIIVGVIVVLFIAVTIWSKTLKNSSLFSEINIPDGEFLHYSNYFEGKKYADLYVVTKQEDNGKGGKYYRSYIDLINVADNKMPSPDYKSWPSFCVSDPELGSTIESEANINTNVFNNWIGFRNLTHWYMKVNYKQRSGEYVLKYKDNGGTREIKKSFRKIRTTLPSSCHWATLFLQSRFVDYQSNGLQATVNPVYLPVPMILTYRVAARETMQTGAGAFKVLKYRTPLMVSTITTPEGLKLFIPPKGEPVRRPTGPFAVYVEDSDRRLTVKMENTAGLGGDYILEEVSDVKSHKLFRK